ncbi:anti-phage deoxyguanosine triphosphatase [Pseudoalteromonas denitrificans]|uniref:Deoxyguanosinetriphosphate triphosphohydrolase-like protein n=1 Tax=Pseudoalteromonas denitrificans DSM 6059 TaxID=1123010 RepID=A0A1I1NUR7_9GAMM|nr:anti-phage deoxyguanosine triphosphatase [Pseudoalteromonas denitrificans]SFD01146.1 dGTPase [Pseudoalteromonas denitrificans DSM 6059]
MSHWIQRRSTEDKNRPNDHRTPFQKDRSRIIHAAAFRRLQAKTQIMGIGVDDFYRTRLTHSLEVAQIGSGILGQLRSTLPDTHFLPCRSQIETLCLAHDIGHPPFGHGGEIALNYMMRNSGGFEGNAQTLRIVSKLEPYTPGFGMNLTRRTLLGFIKYPDFIDNLWLTQPKVDPTAPFIKADLWLPAKGLYSDDKDVFDWILKPLNESDRQLIRQHQPLDKYRNKTCFKSLDASIMELADDIAYAVHDLEDAIATGIISLGQWHDFALSEFKSISGPWLKSNIDRISHKLFSKHHSDRKDAIGELVNLFITENRIENNQHGFSSEILSYSLSLPDEYKAILQVLKRFINKLLIRKPKMQQIEFKGQKLIIELFNAFSTDPLRLLPENTQQRWLETFELTGCGNRVICDYIAGMSDEYAYKVHNRLFSAQVD